MDKDPVIACDALTKVFKVNEPNHGIRSTLKALVTVQKQREVFAIRNLSLRISRGERVALIGPNGAGKSTTIKMLTGIMVPSSGHIAVLGLSPSERRQDLSRRIGTVFGQRSQLWYHLAPRQTFELLRRVYDISAGDYQTRLRYLSNLFEVAEFIERPVNQLSLGQRMRCEVMASLLHRPEILFLDEPTIGLDIQAKATIRQLVLEESQRDGITVLLTSHDTGDIESVCHRVLIINQGSLLIDSSLNSLRNEYLGSKLLKITTESEALVLDELGMQCVRRQPCYIEFLIDTSIMPIDQAIQRILRAGTIKDIAIGEKPMEEIIKALYVRSGHAGK